MSSKYESNRWKRVDDWDDRPLRLDKFAVEDPENGFSAFNGKADPKPSIEVNDGRITSMDGVLIEDFDLIDAFIAKYHIDLAVAEEAMAIPSSELARMLVDMNVPRTELTLSLIHI